MQRRIILLVNLCCTVASAFFFCFVCNGQEEAQLLKKLEYINGRIITGAGDTIAGEIRILSPYMSCREVILKDSAGNEKHFFPDEVVAYSLGTMNFRSVDDERFMQVISTGTLTLYAYDFENRQTDLVDFLKQILHSGSGSKLEGPYRLYLEKEKEGLKAVDRKSFIRDISPYINDNLEIAHKLRDGIYTYDNIIDIIKEYNEQQTSSGRKEYFSDRWEMTVKQNATYYRIIESDTLNLRYIMRIYTADERLMETKTFASRGEIKIWEVMKSGSSVISLRGLYLADVPEQLFQMNGITDLDLCETGLDTIPFALASLSELRKLDLSNNRIADVPDIIGRLIKLEELDLSYNRLDEFPTTICSLKNLKKLNLSFNNIKRIPPEIGAMENLECLMIMSNNIASVPDELGMLRNLKSTDITWNIRLRRHDFRKIKKLLPEVADINQQER